MCTYRYVYAILCGIQALYVPDNFIYKGEIMLNTEKYLLALVLGFSFMSTAVIAQDTDEDTDVE